MLPWQSQLLMLTHDVSPKIFSSCSGWKLGVNKEEKWIPSRYNFTTGHSCSFDFVVIRLYQIPNLPTATICEWNCTKVTNAKVLIKLWDPTKQKLWVTSKVAKEKEEVAEHGGGEKICKEKGGEGERRWKRETRVDPENGNIVCVRREREREWE